MGHIFHMNRYKPKTSAYLSFLATAVSSTIIGAYVIFEYIPAQDYRKMPNNYYINDNTLFNIISNNGIESWIALLGYFVISVSLAALSTYLFIMLYAIKREHSGHKKLIKNTGRVLIVLIIIPLLIAFMAAGTGKVERYPNLGTIHWNMSAQRVANDTIVIINNGYHNPDGVDLGYYINKNMSFMMMAFNETGWYNSSADSWYRLNFTVNSETVLGGESGQKVTVTGPEYSSVNNTTVEILLYNDNETFVYNNIYLGRL